MEEDEDEDEEEEKKKKKEKGIATRKSISIFRWAVYRSKCHIVFPPLLTLLASIRLTDGHTGNWAQNIQQHTAKSADQTQNMKIRNIHSILANKK